MKHYLLPIMALTALMLTACDNDDDNYTEGNFMVINHTYYPVDSCMAIVGDEDADSYDGYKVDLYVVISGTSLSTDGVQTGNGGYMHFTLYSSSATQLDSGLYNFTTTTPYPVDSFSYGLFNWKNGTTAVQIGAIGGRMRITYDTGNTYNIAVSFFDSDADQAYTHYYGNVQFVTSTPTPTSK